MVINALLRGRSLINFKNLEKCDLVVLAGAMDREISEIDGFEEYLKNKEIHIVVNMVMGEAIGYHKIKFFDNFNVTKLIRPYSEGYRVPGSANQNIPLEDEFLNEHHNEFMLPHNTRKYDYPGTGIACIAYTILDLKPDILNIVGLDFYDNLNHGESNYLVSDRLRNFGTDVGEGLSEGHLKQLKIYQNKMQNVICDLVEHRPHMQVNLITRCEMFNDRIKNIKNLKLEIVK